jgi:hypothetical protein
MPKNFLFFQKDSHFRNVLVDVGSVYSPTSRAGVPRETPVFGQPFFAHDGALAKHARPLLHTQGHVTGPG